MYALLTVYVCDSSDKLCEYLLSSLDRKRAFITEVVVQFISLTVFQNEPYLVLGDYNFVESGDVRVYELAVVMDFASEVWIFFARGFEDDLGAIGEVVSCKVDFSKRSLANEFANRVVPNAVEVLGAELSAQKSVGERSTGKELLTHEVQCTSSQAVYGVSSKRTLEQSTATTAYLCLM